MEQGSFNGLTLGKHLVVAALQNGARNRFGSRLRTSRKAEVVQTRTFRGLFRINWLDPAAAAERGISPADIRAAVRGRNRDSSGGDLEAGKRRYLLRTVGRYGSIEEMEETVVARIGDSLVRLGDIAEVELSHYELRSRSSVNGKPNIGVSVDREPGSNVIEIKQAMLPTIDDINEELLNDLGMRLVLTLLHELRRAQLQRGLQVYTEICSACHGLKYVPFRTLGDDSGPGLPEEQVRAYAEFYEVYDEEIDDWRPARPVDHFPMSQLEKMEKQLEKAINQQLMQTVSTLATNSGRASAIALGALFYDDPKRVLTDLERYREVTNKDIKRVAAEFPRSFLIADEVGLGKTIETGLILRYLLVSQKVKRVLVLAPASVQPQWQEELREKFNLHFYSYSQGQFKDPFGHIISPQTNPWNTCNLILTSSHLVRRQSRVQELLEAKNWDLIILDEAHHARRKSPQARKDTFNSLLSLMQQIKDKTLALMLLSATPMQIDPIEVFDLLNLLGLKNHWSYGDNFCYYFASLSQKADKETLNFWQVMSNDYFGQGGKPCPRLQQVLEKRDKLLAYQLKDVWQGKNRIVNPKQILEHSKFLEISRQYLTVNTPLKDLMFRHTRDTLREYYKLGLLARDIPQRDVQDNAIVLEPQREIPLYVAVSDYVRHFYRLAQKQERKALGFLMTLYRKRLTSSFYAIRESLQRRLESLIAGKGSSITLDDFNDIDEADDAIIEGLESYLEPVDPQEIQYLEDLLRQFENTGEDTKLSHFINTLRRELIERESAIIFTQYTDTMDYLRDSLKQLYGERVACYSGRGGELYRGGNWQIVRKEEIKRRFREGEVKILLCTESASEGLNLQTCGVLINYDLPWNPMRVEQRIGRLDRIGQIHPTVKIHNFYYDGTVEAKVYKKLRSRINAFTNIVGNLQPILARVPTFIERAAMSADPEEEDVLMSDFDNSPVAPRTRRNGGDGR